MLVYACKQCNIYFPIRRMLELHECKFKIDDDDDEENSWEVETLDENLLLQQQQPVPTAVNPRKEKGRQCPFCPFSCDNYSTYRSHVKRKHCQPSEPQGGRRQTVKQQLATSSPAGDKAKIRSCPHCPFETRTKSTLYSHISRTHKVGTKLQKQGQRTKIGDTGYACNYCTFAAATMLSLKYHTAREHGGGAEGYAKQPVIEFPVREFDCEQCDYKAKIRKAMQHHVKAEHQMKPNEEGMFCCHMCSYESFSKMGVQRHISIKHDKPRRQLHQSTKLEAFSCETCDYRTYNAKVLEWHAQRHQLVGAVDDYFCDDCDFATWTKTLLLTHIKRNHSQSPASLLPFAGKGLLECDRCDYTTKNKHVMKVHVIRKHTEDFNHTCEICGKKYKVKADLTNHTRFQHREQPIMCDVCGKQCRNSNLLYLHQKFAHYKPEFECHICKRRMVSEANLAEHVLKQHEQKQEVICEECGKSFTRQSRLKLHMRTHLGLRPYACKICGKSFGRRNGLRQHLLIHTGQRPYACDICGKDFTQKTGLISHRKSHPGSHPPLPRITIDHVLSSLQIV